MENPEKSEEGICIISFDGGGPGSISQLRILDEIMMRLAFKSDLEVDELLPADYFDLMGGVGFGGLVAVLLGRLRMTTSQAMEELAVIGAEVFPEGEDMVTMEVNTARLRKATENMLQRYGHSVDIKMRDNSTNRCKVVLFAAPTAAMDYCQPFRSYRSPRNSLECNLVDALCATMVTSPYFSPVAIGPRLRKQTFAGIPHGFNNPTREVLKEVQLVFGENSLVSLVLSLGAGQRASISDFDGHMAHLSRVRCDTVERELQYQLRGLGEYIRLNVDRGLETIRLDDWHELGSIETHTNVYLEMNPITTYIDKSFQWLLQRNGSISLGQLSGSSADCVIKFTDYLAMEFKQMHDVIQQCGIAKITLVDAIGNDIPIPTQFCVTYAMLLDVISVYFKHQKAPGSDFVERGDYRLVHGNRRNIVSPTEWTCIEKAGLKVEMSMILRTRNEDKERCPRCGTMFEGRSIDGWAQCLSCSRHFQIETQVQSADSRLEDDDIVEPGVVTPAMGESKNSEILMKEHTRNVEAGTLQFRLISVINLLEASAYPEQYATLILAIMRVGGVLPGVKVPLSAVRREIGEEAIAQELLTHGEATFEGWVKHASSENYTNCGGIGHNKWIMLNAQNNWRPPASTRASSNRPSPVSHFSNGYAPRPTSCDPSALMTRRSSRFSVINNVARCTSAIVCQPAHQPPSRATHIDRLAAYIPYSPAPFVPYDGSIPVAGDEAKAVSSAVTKDNARQRTNSPAQAVGKPKKKLDIHSLFQDDGVLRKAPRSSSPTPAPASIPTVRPHHGVLGRPRMAQSSISSGPAPATPSQTPLTAMPPNVRGSVPRLRRVAGHLPSVPPGQTLHQMNTVPQTWGYYYPPAHYDPNVPPHYRQPHIPPPHMAPPLQNPEQTPLALHPPKVSNPSQTRISMPMSPRVPPISVSPAAPQTPQLPRPTLPTGNRFISLAKRPIFIKNSAGEMIDPADLFRKVPARQEDPSAVPYVKKEEMERRPVSIRLETAFAHRKRIEAEKLKDKDRFKKDDELKAKRDGAFGRSDGLPTPSRTPCIPMTRPISPRLPPIGVPPATPQTTQLPHSSLSAGDRSKRPLSMQNSAGEIADVSRRVPRKRYSYHPPSRQYNTHQCAYNPSST